MFWNILSNHTFCKMKKKSIYAGILSIVFIPVLIVWLLHSNLSVDTRSNYEAFLLGVYKKVSLPQEKLPGIKPDRPDFAAFHEYILSLDPNTKTIPRERLLKSFQLTKAQKIKAKLMKKDPIYEIEWKNVPANISGRVRKIVLDPSDASNKRLWAGSVTGGLWYNIDATNSESPWKNVPGFFENLAVGAIAFDPDNNDIMYVGTGESYTAVNIYRESSGRGTGIWKSTDHGTTWNLLPESTNFAYTNDILVRNEGGTSVVYAAVISGTYKGQTHGSDAANGLYRSIDGGNSWTQVLPNIIGDTSPYAPSDIEEVDGGKLLVGTMRNIAENGAGVLLSSANGTDWNINDYFAIDRFDPLNSLYPGRVKFAVAPSNPKRVYAIISGGYKRQSGFIRDRDFYCILLQSFDGGDTWSEFAPPSFDLEWGSWGTLTWHAMALGVDANNENTIILGGLNLFKLTNTDIADTTEDTALRWQCISNWGFVTAGKNGFPEYVHADQHTILYRPGSSDEVFIATDGGVFYSDNITISNVAERDNPANIFPSFTEINNGLNTIQYYTLAIDPGKDASFYYGGTQDNGTLRYGGQPIYVANMVSGGDGAFTFVDQNEPDIVITSSYHNSYTLSHDGGITFKYVSKSVNGLFINPADYDSQTNMLFANGMGLGGAISSVENKNIDELFKMEITKDSAISKFIPLNTGSTVPYSSIKVSPYDETGTATLIIGTQSGKLFKITNILDEAHTVMEIGSSAFPAANISCIAIGRTEDELLVTFSNYGVSSVWYSNNGGVTWAEKEANLPDMPIRWGLFNPFNYSQVLLATEIGIWSVDDITVKDVEWFPENESFPNVRTDMITIRQSDKKVVVATHGRGMFEGIMKEVINTIPDPDPAPKEYFAIYPNPVKNDFTITSNSNNPILYKGTIYTIEGTMVKQFIYKTAQELTVDINNFKSGIYLVDMKGENGTQIIKKMVKQ